MKIGFIGCGNMATAIIHGILESGIASKEEIMASAKSPETYERIRTSLQIRTGSNKETAAWAQILFLAVKPQFYEEVLGEIASDIPEESVVVSIAPGKTLEWLTGKLDGHCRIVRAMPNTPAMVGEGMTGVCPAKAVSEEEMQLVLRLMNTFGRSQVVPERLLDVVTGVSGSSPAYVFMFIEAMADAAVADGMPRKMAYEFAAQAVLGSAKMVLETGLHPGALKDMVCSPGGTTIEAVRVLEAKGMRSAVFEAMKACTEKAKGM